MKYAYHQGTLWTSQVAFVYVISLKTNNNSIIVCIDMVLPMAWVDSPKFFCTFSETLADVENSLVNMLLPVPGYGAITKIPEKGPGLPHTLNILTYID